MDSSWIAFIKILQPIIHYSFHLLLPGLLAWLFFRMKWKSAWAIMLATMLVDADHLLSNPVFDPNRCSIGHHLLHTPYAIAAYFLLLIFPKTRILALGLLLHMFTDFQDCIWSEYLRNLNP